MGFKWVNWSNLSPITIILTLIKIILSTHWIQFLFVLRFTKHEHISIENKRLTSKIWRNLNVWPTEILGF